MSSYSHILLSYVIYTIERHVSTNDSLSLHIPLILKGLSLYEVQSLIPLNHLLLKTTGMNRVLLQSHTYATVQPTAQQNYEI